MQKKHWNFRWACAGDAKMKITIEIEIDEDYVLETLRPGDEELAEHFKSLETDERHEILKEIRDRVEDEMDISELEYEIVESVLQSRIDGTEDEEDEIDEDDVQRVLENDE